VEDILEELDGIIDSELDDYNILDDRIADLEDILHNRLHEIENNFVPFWLNVVVRNFGKGGEEEEFTPEEIVKINPIAVYMTEDHETQQK
jgi:hypothetical protein